LQETTEGETLLAGNTKAPVITIMVSSNEADDNIEGNVSGESQLPMSEPSQHTKLLRLARLEAWAELIVNLQASSSETILFVVEESMDEEGGPSDTMDQEVTSLLHVVCTSANVPLSVIEMILDLSGGPPSVATIPNHLQQTPLHITLHFIPERTDIVECLVRAAPEGVHLRDTQHLRPIDILCQKLIMMEEVIKYADSSQYSDDEEQVDDLWKTAKILAQASCSNANSHQMCDDTPPRPQPIVHSCLLGKDFPFALTERAMKRYWKQLREANADGDLPLHVIARVSPPPKGEGDDDEEDDDEGDFLDRVVTLYPQAASQGNHQGKIPLVVALESGRQWNSGIARLLEAHPPGIEDLQIPPQVYPLLFARLSKCGKTSTLYGMIQAKPELFLRPYDDETNDS
jgi:hypothetical protein